MGEMGRVPACQRTRLTCTVLRRGAANPTESTHTAGPDKATIHEQFVVLNELKIGSEGSSHLPYLELYANGTLLTTVQADGDIFATATGSTAYNLAASGPLLHPSLPSIILNAISPHTLSFRATILPPDIVMTVLVPKGSRSAAYAYFDGKSKTELHQGDMVTIDTSASTFSTIDGGDTTSHWFASLRALFSYNYRSATQGGYQTSSNLSLESQMGRGFGDELQEEDEHEPWDIEFHATH